MNLYKNIVGFGLLTYYKANDPESLYNEHTGATVHAIHMYVAVLLQFLKFSISCKQRG